MRTAYIVNWCARLAPIILPRSVCAASLKNYIGGSSHRRTIGQRQLRYTSVVKEMYSIRRMRCLLSLLLIASCASGQTDYKSNAEAAFDVLQQYYNTTSGIWDTCGWWNGANCMTAIADLAAADSSVLSTATSVFAHTYTQAPQSNPQLQVTKVATRENIFTYYGSPPGNRSSFDHFGTRDSNSGNPTGFIDSCYDDNGW